MQSRNPGGKSRRHKSLSNPKANPQRIVPEPLERRLLMTASVHYYNQGFWAGAPVTGTGISTTVNTVDVNSPSGNLDPSLRKSSNSAIFTGSIKTDAAGIYSFISNTEDDGYLYVNGQLVSEDPGIHPAEDAPLITPIDLAGNTMYNFVFLVSHDTGPAAAHLEWVTPTGSTPVIIPADHLSPTSDVPTAPSGLSMDSTIPLTTNQIGFTFTDTSNSEVFFQLQRSYDTGKTWETISQTDVNGNHIEDDAPVPGQAGMYRVVAVNFDGVSTPSDPITATAPAQVPANVPGVELHSFNGERVSQLDAQNPKNFINNLLESTGKSPLVGPQDYQQIAFVGNTSGSSAPADESFGTGSPNDQPNPDVSKIHDDSFTTVWTGKIVIDTTGMYTFVTNTDDDGYFYLKDTLLSSDPGVHTERNAATMTPVMLQAGQSYNFVFLQNDISDTAGAHLLWVTPNNPLPTPIPAFTPGTPPFGGLESVQDVPHHQTYKADGMVDVDLSTESAAGMLAAASAGGGVTLTWTDQSASELWFEVQRSADSGTTWTTIGRAGFDTTIFTDATAAAGTTYTYRVRGVNFDGAGPFSNTASSMGGTGGNPLPADFNTDGKVNFSDLLILAQNYNKTGVTHAQGDANMDGKVNFSDLLILAQSYGKTGGMPPPTLPGDFNGDGKVDFNDLLTLAQHYGKGGATLAQGDANKDGKVDFSDLLILAQNYGKKNPAAAAAAKLSAIVDELKVTG